MKKMQNYLTKPDQFRKKLQNPTFRHDFMQWSRSHLCQGPSRHHSKSKSPHQRSKSHLGYSSSKSTHNISHNISNTHIGTHHHNNSKENITPNYKINTNNSSSSLNKKSSTSLAHKNIKNANYSTNNNNNSTNNNKSKNGNNNNKKQKTDRSHSRLNKPLPYQSKSHSLLQEHPYRSKDERRLQTNYTSLRKSEGLETNYRSERPRSHNSHYPHSQSHNSQNINSSRMRKQPNMCTKTSTNKQSNRNSNTQNSSHKNNANTVVQFKYSYRTRQGVLATNPNKTNQDRLLIKTHINGYSTFAVADGHGSNGHLVAQAIVTNMGAMLDKQLMQAVPNAKTNIANKTNANNTKISTPALSQSQIQSQQTQKIAEPQIILPNIYNKLQKILNDTTQINASYSGSTLVTVILDDQYLTCANVGDSRAILARQVDKKSWQMIYLSQDQKPCVQSQRKRILKNGGRVHSLKDQRGQNVGPLRVWLPNQNVQGLAMSRSMGDNVSKPYGVTHKPQIIKIPTDKRDKFILIASDGVWEFITNQEVLQLIVPYYRQKKLQQACDALLKLSYDRWTVEDTTVVDDISFILIFLDN